MVKTHRAVIHVTISLNFLLNDEEMYLEGSLKVPHSNNVIRVSPTMKY
jgi:hypothetical protein